MAFFCRPLRFEARGRYAVTPEAMWPYAADTDKLNRVVSFPPMYYRALPREGGGTRAVVEWRAGPLCLARWEEAAFQWQYPRFYDVTRDYQWGRWTRWFGPISRMRGGMELTPAPDGGTYVRVWAELTPRNPLGWLLCSLAVGPLGVQSGLRQCALFDRYLRGELADPFPQLLPRRGLARLVPVPLRSAGPRGTDRRVPTSPAAITNTGQEVSGSPSGVAEAAHPSEGPPSPEEPAQQTGVWCQLIDEGTSAPLVARLRQHLESAPEMAVIRMRPFELADSWGADRRATLTLFLRATLAGVLQMTWEVICPNCRVGKARHTRLEDLRDAAHCDTCDIVYDARFDQNIEVRFSVAPAVRRIADRTYCVGGPRNAPHIAVRLTLEPTQEAQLEIHVVPGAYELRSLQSAGRLQLDVRTGVPSSTPGGATASVPGTRGGQGAPGTAGGDSVVSIHADRIIPQHVTLEVGSAGSSGGASQSGIQSSLWIKNETAVPVTLELAERAWPESATTAAFIATFQEFRDLFSSQVLSPGLQLAIQRQTFLFTDLFGSTELYERVGQARAFGIVQAHFVILMGAVMDSQGAIVKTIGDAVMATFATPADGVRAALEIQRRIRALDTDGAVDPARLVKIGLHTGPCVAVTANERLDYFGTSVNIASRIEGTCVPGQIAVTADVLADPQAAALVVPHTLEPDSVSLRGISRPVALYRLIDPCGLTVSSIVDVSTSLGPSVMLTKSATDSATPPNAPLLEAAPARQSG